MAYTGFSSWAEVVTAVNAGEQLYYQAPLDWRPVAVKAELWKNGVRIDPRPDADRFMADEGHLSRFKRKVRP